jgi:hypothetical protein
MRFSTLAPCVPEATPPQREILTSLFDKYVAKTLDFSLKHLAALVPATLHHSPLSVDH